VRIYFIVMMHIHLKINLKKIVVNLLEIRNYILVVLTLTTEVSESRGIESLVGDSVRSRVRSLRASG